MTPLPLFSYPTTIAWIDDDNLFLKAISHVLGNHFTLKTFNDSLESLTFFENYKPTFDSTFFLRGCEEIESFDVINHMPVDINTEMFTLLHKHETKKNEISVAVIDHNMPGIDGLELCYRLKELPIKKILLTGEIDYPKATVALNDGLIDCYIRKDSPNLIEEIKQHLTKLSQKYFFDSGRGLLSHLEADHPLPISDPEFREFFKNWCTHHNIREHYLMDKQGNFILVDQDNNISHFIIHTDRTLSAFIDLHKDDEEVTNLVEAVSNRNLIPFFGKGKDAWEIKQTDWATHFYKPEIFSGKEKYYFTTLKANI